MMRSDSVCRQQSAVFQFVTSLTEEEDDYETSDHEADHLDNADGDESFHRSSVDERKGGKSCLVM
jgi:hypothetical protein